MAKANTINKRIAKLQNAILSADSIIEDDPEPISMSPTLDRLLGGGITPGSTTIITGKYKIGKTTIALRMAKKAQENGYKVVIANVEHRLTRRDLKQSGLDRSEEKLEVMSSNEKEIYSAEDFLVFVKNKLETEKNIFVIIDSVSALCSEKLMVEDFTQQDRSNIPHLLSKFTTLIAPIIKVSKNIIVMITHQVSDTGISRSTIHEVSGNKIQYAADFKLASRYKQMWEDPTTGKTIGLKIHWKTQTSALGAPDLEGISYVRFGEGVDEVAEIFDIGTTIKVIEQAGAWYKISYKEKEYKGNGELKFCAMLKENPEVLKFLTEEVKKWTS